MKSRNNNGFNTDQIIDLLMNFKDIIVKNGKMIYPFIAGIAVCTTVFLALGASGAKNDKLQELTQDNPVTQESSAPEEIPEVDVTEIPLLENEDIATNTLINNYFSALAEGNTDNLKTYCDTIDDDRLLEITELAKYIERYGDFCIYTKAGLNEGTAIAYVCYKMYFTGKDAGFPGYRTLYVDTKENGVKYLKFDLTDEENEYIVQASSQADVVDMNNRVTVEYNDLMSAEPDLLRYLNEVHNEVQVAMGVIYGQQVTGDGEDTPQENPDSGSANENPDESTDNDTPVELFAKATSTVNVRVSDSQLSDKLGKVDAGTKLKVLEQLANGWTKVEFQNQEGYIKSEFLNVIEDAAGAEVIGTITADSNVNVRISPSETAERLGILTGGDVADLLARENGWCKINYQGKIGYVKAEFVN